VSAKLAANGWPEPGVELDALVAEKVLGHYESDRDMIPRFSTDAAAALQLVSTIPMAPGLPAKYWTLRLVVYSYSRTYATFVGERESDDDDWKEGNGENATASAICYAALHAVELANREAKPKTPWPTEAQR
jgi:hypothetical protein